MADGVEPQPPLAHATDEHAAEARLPAPVTLSGHGRRESLPHAPKFRAAMAALMGIAVAAVVIAITALIGGNTIAYNLCGVGSTNCSIGVGTPSPDRLLLLRREALELALYTFKYISGTQNVVAILPPGHTAAITAGRLSPQPPSRSSKA